MRKNLIAKIITCFIIAVTFLGCRNDDPNQLLNEQNPEQIVVNSMLARGNGLTLQEKVRDLYFSYYKNNIDTRNTNIDFKNIRVDFRFASQVINNDDGTKMILYPFVEYNKVENIVIAKISKEEDIVEFYFAEKDIYIQQIITNFDQHLANYTNKEFVMEELILPKPKDVPPKTELPFTFPPTIPMEGGGGDGGSSGGDGDGSLPSLPTAVPPDLPIASIIDFLSCLNINQSANLTIFAEKTNMPFNVGHAFISISQGNNTMTFGYYPKNGGFQSLNGPGVFGNNGGHAYSSAWDMGSITPTQLQQLIGTAIAFSNANYSLNGNNCSDFAIFAMMIAGVNTNTNGLDTPTTVHNLIGSHSTSTNGVAPATNRTCP